MIKIKQIEFNDIKSFEYDLIITSSGFEERATYQSEVLNLSGAQKIVLGFSTETREKRRQENDLFFIKQGFLEVIKDGHESDSTYFSDLIHSFLIGCKKEEVNIYIDYSSMTRNWYAQLLLYLFKHSNLKKINAYFSYSVAEYEKATDSEILNKVVEPIFGFCNLSLPTKPTALLICLGNEVNRAYGLKEYFDAATYLFYSDSEGNNSFSTEVELVNKDIIDEIKPDNIFVYPIKNLLMTNFMINNICDTLSEKYRVIIAPCGPKPFTLLSLIASLNRNGRIEVWRISPAENIPKYKRSPSGEVLTMRLTLGN